MAKVKTLMDKDNNVIYPQTSATVVYTPSGDIVNDIILKGVSIAPIASVEQTPEVTQNKVTTITSASSDTEYPSAKATYQLVMANRNEGLKVAIVSTLPVSDIDTKTIYLVPKVPSSSGDAYDEYMYINVHWEHIGTTEIDLSAYALKVEVPTTTSQLTNNSGFITKNVDNLTKYSQTADFSEVAFSGNYNDLNNIPNLAPVATSGLYSDLTGKPSLALVATSGNYTDLQNRPSLSTVAVTGNYSDLNGKPTLSTVATSGNYNDLNNRPTLSTVATTGNYNDLNNKPIPQISAADSGKFLSVNSSGSIVVIDLPVYDGSVS